MAILVWQRMSGNRRYQDIDLSGTRAYGSRFREGFERSFVVTRGNCLILNAFVGSAVAMGRGRGGDAAFNGRENVEENRN
ncbi:hypothetical protein [Rhizobium sp. BK251]|uniref:hypothetical protein n=1 Tax=Rhizobium sp. BK251 TaxID=2512125 RepID=UPI0010488C79|nr:hypothetical protein [Rhizobium sp. BK251]